MKGFTGHPVEIQIGRVRGVQVSKVSSQSRFYFLNNDSSCCFWNDCFIQLFVRFAFLLLKSVFGRWAEEDARSDWGGSKSARREERPARGREDEDQQRAGKEREGSGRHQVITFRFLFYCLQDIKKKKKLLPALLLPCLPLCQQTNYTIYPVNLPVSKWSNFCEMNLILTIKCVYVIKGDY